jgi:hypothetical protein
MHSAALSIRPECIKGRTILSNVEGLVIFWLLLLACRLASWRSQGQAGLPAGSPLGEAKGRQVSWLFKEIIPQ